MTTLRVPYNPLLHFATHFRTSDGTTWVVVRREGDELVCEKLDSFK